MAFDLRGIIVIAFVASTAPALSQELFIAGAEPSVRPADAPVVQELRKDATWYQQALSGVEQPYPYSLRFLEDQGNWFTPFRKPGMTGPYDLRNWH